MKTVHKFLIEHIADEVIVHMPEHAEVLHVGVQAGLICLWARVDPKKPLIPKQFYIRGTGHPLHDHFLHVGTVQLGPFVWHIFEV